MAPIDVVIRPTDALLVVDVQIDFLPGGSLAVADGDQVIGPLNRVLTDCTRAVNVHAGDGARALAEMRTCRAEFVAIDALANSTFPSFNDR